MGCGKDAPEDGDQDVQKAPPPDASRRPSPASRFRASAIRKPIGRPCGTRQHDLSPVPMGLPVTRFTACPARSWAVSSRPLITASSTSGMLAHRSVLNC